MNSPQFGLRVASLIAAGWALAHLVRLLTAMPVQVGPLTVPPWVSLPAMAVGGALAVWFWRLGAKKSSGDRFD